MKKQSLLQLFIQWLKTKKEIASLLAIILGINWLVPILYHLPKWAASYSLLLSSLWIVFYGLWDYYKFIKKYEQLLDCYSCLSTLLTEVPVTQGLIEESYQKLIKQLYEQKQQTAKETLEKQQELNDYYTLWAHQIKTPIAAMHLLLKNYKEDEWSCQLEAELFRVEQYVSMVLQYLRLESMASDLVIKSYDVYDLVKASVRKYAHSFIIKKISLDLVPFEGKVITDEKWLSFIIEQILSNSLKYTKTGGRVSILFETVPQKKLMISDTGIGIKPEDLPRLFDRGFTGFNGRVDKCATGIGLYLCQKIALRLGITLEVASQLGKGTTISIIFEDQNN